jgi:general secretion pathway protein D
MEHTDLVNYSNFGRFLEMSTNRLKGIGALLLLWLGLAGSPVVTATVVSIEPASNNISAGDTLSLDIKVTDVTDLYGFQFDIGFSPSILSATAVTEGAFLPSGGSTLFIPGTIDNVLGTISFTADSLVGPIPGVTGSDMLASVSFQAVGAGTSAVSLSNIILLDSTLAEIATTSTNGVVEVQGISPVPEPGTLLLLLGGWVAFWSSRCVTRPQWRSKDRWA